MGGKRFSQQTRRWYCDKVLKTLQLNERMTQKELIFQLKKLNNKRYPLDRYVINYFLKLLRQQGKLKYVPNPQTNKSGAWQIN